MKKAVSVIIFTCLALSLMAQNGIKVNYKGSRPTITDFVWAAFPALNYEDEDETGDRPWKALENAMLIIFSDWKHVSGMSRTENTN